MKTNWTKTEAGSKPAFLAQYALRRQDKQWINAQLEQTEARLNALLEQAETRLLTAFYKWSSPNDKRPRVHGLRIGAVEEELADVQERIEKLQGGGQQARHLLTHMKFAVIIERAPGIAIKTRMSRTCPGGISTGATWRKYGKTSGRPSFTSRAYGKTATDGDPNPDPRHFPCKQFYSAERSTPSVHTGSAEPCEPTCTARTKRIAELRRSNRAAWMSLLRRLFENDHRRTL